MGTTRGYTTLEWLPIRRMPAKIARATLIMVTLGLSMGTAARTAPHAQPAPHAVFAPQTAQLAPRALIAPALRTHRAGSALTTQLASSACPMAHCDAQLSSNEAITVPISGATVAWAFQPHGAIARYSLGCTVGTTVAVCVSTDPVTQSIGNYARPYLYALDAATGRRLWDSGHTVNGYVAQGVPLIDAAGNCYVSDNNYLVSFDQTGKLRWRVPNPAHLPMVSFNIIGDGHLVGQGSRGPLLVVEPTNGRISGSVVLTDTIGGVAGAFVTVNTVTVAAPRGTGATSRIYTLTNFCPSQGCTDPSTLFSPGRLYAIDVVGGLPRVVWHWDFAGPSGGSPLTVLHGTTPVIFFDGAGQHQGDPHHPWMFSVQDLGSTPKLLWAVDFTATYGIPYITGIQSAPVHDPRGGFWVYVYGSYVLFRFDDMSGALLQAIDVNALVGGSGYIPLGPPSLAVNGNKPVLYVSAADWLSQTNPTFVNAVDLTSSALLWQLALGTGPNQDFPGQYPVAVTSAGQFIVTERQDGLIYGLKLH